MYTGSFDRVAVVKKEVAQGYSTDYELRKLHAGVCLVMGIETTIGLCLRGILAGLALIALTATYGGCE